MFLFLYTIFFTPLFHKQNRGFVPLSDDFTNDVLNSLNDVTCNGESSKAKAEADMEKERTGRYIVSCKSFLSFKKKKSNLDI